MGPSSDHLDYVETDSFDLLISHDSSLSNPADTELSGPSPQSFISAGQPLLTCKPPPSSEGKGKGRPPPLLLQSKPSSPSRAGLSRLRTVVELSIPRTPSGTAPLLPARQMHLDAAYPTSQTLAAMDRSRTQRPLGPPSGVLSSDSYLGGTIGGASATASTAASLSGGLFKLAGNSQPLQHSSLSGGLFKLAGNQPLHPSSLARGSLSMDLPRRVLDSGSVGYGWVHLVWGKGNPCALRLPFILLNDRL